MVPRTAIRAPVVCAIPFKWQNNRKNFAPPQVARESKEERPGGGARTATTKDRALRGPPIK